jgi:hypothetical protein
LNAVHIVNEIRQEMRGVSASESQYSHSPVDGEWLRKGSSISKHVNSEKKKKKAWFPKGLENKNGAGEGQQEFTKWDSKVGD